MASSRKPSREKPAADPPSKPGSTGDIPLPPRYERFCQEYLIDLNGARAARDSGYSPKAAKEQASRLLTIANVQRRLRQLREARERSTEISRERVLEELARLGFSNMQDYIRVDAGGQAVVDLSALTRAQAAAISKVRVTERVLASSRSKGSGSEKEGDEEEGEGEQKILREVRTELELNGAKIAALKLLGLHVGVKFVQHHDVKVSRSLEDILADSYGEPESAP